MNATRHEGNVNCTYPSFNVSEDEGYRYGLEFEFYLNTSGMDYYAAIDQLRDQLAEITRADILVDLVSVPEDVDAKYCMVIKQDQSLGDNSVEVSVPICSLAGVRHYTEHIFGIISSNSHSTEADCGFHIHISTTRQSGANVNFYNFMLLCDDYGLLRKWDVRQGFSHNVVDVLRGRKPAEARKIKNNVGAVWNLEKKSSSHVEIRTIGGVGYALRPDEVLEDINLYAESFRIANTGEARKRIEELRRIMSENLHKLSKEELVERMKIAEQIGVEF